MGDADDDLPQQLAADRLRAVVWWGGGALGVGGVSAALASGEALEAPAWWLAPLVGVGLMASARLLRPDALALGVGAGVAGVALASWSAAAVGIAVPHPQAPMAVAAALALAAMSGGSGQQGSSSPVWPASAGRPRGGAGWWLVAAVVVSGLHLAAPWAAEGPLAPVVEAAEWWWARPSVGFMLRLLGVLAFVLWPLVLVAVAARLRRERRALAGPVRLALASPLLLLGATSRALDGTQLGGLASVGQDLGEAAVLGALVVLASAAAGSGASWPAVVGRARWRRAGAVAAVVGLAPLALIERAPRPLAWTPGAPTVPVERLFAVLLPAWNDRRARQDLRAQGSSDQAAAELTEAARAIDAELGQAVAALVAGAAAGQLTLERWEQLVGGVNEVSARRHFPYYVDPTEGVQQSDDPGRRWFRLDTYGIESVRRWGAAGGGRATLLQVRRLTPGRGGHPVLGLSRDGQPFALLLSDEIEALASDLARIGQLSPPRCTERQRGDAVFEDAMERCGQRLASLSPGDTGELLGAAVERHEAQHQIDGRSLRRSPLVRRRLMGVDRKLQREVNRELSAYLAELTTPGAAPRLSLARLLRLATIHRGPIEATAARLALEALADDASAVTPAACFLRLEGLDERALRERAAAAWRRQYGSSLRPLTLLR